jgi:myogenesis-regulating glycosidase
METSVAMAHKEMLCALGEHVTVTVSPDPFGFALAYKGRTVLRSDGKAAVTLLRDNFEVRAENAIDSLVTDTMIELTVRTEDPAISLRVTFRLEGRSIVFGIRAAGGASCSKTGVNFRVTEGEHWFGADIMAASQWPLSRGKVVRDPFLSTGNQTAPIWLSSKGVAIHKKDHAAIGFSFNARETGIFNLHALNARSLSFTLEFADDIRGAFLAMIGKIGKPAAVPPPVYFQKPVFNTWISFLTDVNQEGILEYIKEMRRNDFDCGIFSIDDKWMPAYGDLEFDPAKFPAPKVLIGTLKSMGLRVMLWVTPFIDKNSLNYRYAAEQDFLIRKKGKASPFFADWWNGSSALVDFSNPRAREWFVQKLNSLCAEYGIDGFKFDAGDGAFLSGEYESYATMNSWEYTDAFASLGALFPVNELRVSWLTQELGLVQRLRDKAPSWSKTDGLASLVPHGICEGLLGYPFFCADMIGGGWDECFRDGQSIDEQLFVRWTEASALFPIMQFSYAPWKLSAHNRDICRKYVELHFRFSHITCELAMECLKSGLPIVRPLFLEFPEDENVYEIDDQFLLGDRYLVAPVLTADAVSRDVYLPKGIWRDFWTGKDYEGGKLYRNYPADIQTLPLFERIGKTTTAGCA